MRSPITPVWLRSAGRLASSLALLAALPAVAAAQYKPPALENLPIGEKYHFEVAGNIWNPALTGQIASEQFGIAGTNIDFTKDLGFTQTRFRDLRIVLRPSKKQKLRIQYTPIDYISATTLSRNVVFNGINFNVALPIKADFGWNVWRFGYEWDFVYRPRGYVGLLLEGRLTKMSATLASPIDTEFTTVRAPLPAIGVVGRVYPTSNVAINFEVTGMCALQNATGAVSPGCKQALDPKYQASYFDWDIYGTINFNNYIGAQVGWRRMTTLIDINRDTGNLKFQGIWFGGVVRY